MKIKIIFSTIILFLLFIQRNNAQNSENQIKRIFPQYTYQGKKYAKSELPKLIKNDEEAWTFYQKHKRARRATFVCIGISALLASYGYQLDRNGSDLDNPVPALLVGTSAFILIPVFHVKSRRRFKRSIRTFNENIKKEEIEMHLKKELNLSYTGNGLGITLVF